MPGKLFLAPSPCVRSQLGLAVEFASALSRPFPKQRGITPIHPAHAAWGTSWRERPPTSLRASEHPRLRPTLLWTGVWKTLMGRKPVRLLHSPSGRRAPIGAARWRPTLPGAYQRGAAQPAQATLSTAEPTATPARPTETCMNTNRTFKVSPEQLDEHPFWAYKSDAAPAASQTAVARGMAEAARANQTRSASSSSSSSTRGQLRAAGRRSPSLR